MRIDTRTQTVDPEGQNLKVGPKADDNASRLASFDRLMVFETTHDFGNIADGDGEETGFIAVTGAALGDFAIASIDVDLQGMQVITNITAANNLKVRVQNETGGAIDLASATLRILVFKRA